MWLLKCQIKAKTMDFNVITFSVFTLTKIEKQSLILRCAKSCTLTIRVDRNNIACKRMNTKKTLVNTYSTGLLSIENGAD